MGILESSMRFLWLVRAHRSVDRGEELRRKVCCIYLPWNGEFRVAVVDAFIFSEKERVGRFRGILDGGVGIWMFA